MNHSLSQTSFCRCSESDWPCGWAACSEGQGCCTSSYWSNSARTCSPSTTTFPHTCHHLSPPLSRFSVLPSFLPLSCKHIHCSDTGSCRVHGLQLRQPAGRPRAIFIFYPYDLTYMSSLWPSIQPFYFFKALLKICSELMTFPNEIWGLEIYVRRQHLVLKQSLDLERPGLFPLPYSASSELRMESG